MTTEQLIGAGLAVAAIAVGVLLVVLFRSAAVWWTEWQSRPRPAAEPTPRAVDRAWRLASTGFVTLAAAMALSYAMVVMSVPGGAIEGMLDHLRTWAEGWWRVVGGLLAGGWLVFHAWRFVTLVELLTNQPAAWRTKANQSIVPLDSEIVRAAGVLVYGGLLIAIVLVFGGVS